jgi:hypothetical protein
VAVYEIEVRQATVADLNRLIPLFDAYRRFYRHPTEPLRSTRAVSNAASRARFKILNYNPIECQQSKYLTTIPSFSRREVLSAVRHPMVMR